MRVELRCTKGELDSLIANAKNASRRQRLRSFAGLWKGLRPGLLHGRLRLQSLPKFVPLVTLDCLPMSTINGFGTLRYDWSYHPNGTAEATVWFVAGFLPVLPLRRERIRVRSAGPRRFGGGEHRTLRGRLHPGICRRICSTRTSANGSCRRVEDLFLWLRGHSAAAGRSSSFHCLGRTTATGNMWLQLAQIRRLRGSHFLHRSRFLGWSCRSHDPRPFRGQKRGIELDEAAQRLTIRQ